MNNGYKIARRKQKSSRAPETRVQSSEAKPKSSNSRKSRTRSNWVRITRTSHIKKPTHEMQIVNYKFAIKIFNRMKHFAFMSLSFG